MTLLSKSTRMQIAADDLFGIAEAIEAIGKRLDKFHADHGEALYERIEKECPQLYYVDTMAIKLNAMAREWEPPHD